MKEQNYVLNVVVSGRNNVKRSFGCIKWLNNRSNFFGAARHFHRMRLFTFEKKTGK